MFVVQKIWWWELGGDSIQDIKIDNQQAVNARNQIWEEGIFVPIEI